MRVQRARRGGHAQALIEFAMVMSLAMAIVMLTLSAEWAIFQVQELKDAASGAVHATLVATPSELDAQGCDSRILADIRHDAGILPIPSGAQLCTPPSRTDVLTWSGGDLSICIIAQPTVYTPSHVTAVVTDKIAPLGPVSLFNLTAKATSTSTDGPTGIPGTAGASPCP